MTHENVIKGLGEALQVLANHVPERYLGYSAGACLDAIALLKEQEPVAPELQSGGNYVCGNCGMYTVGFAHPLTGERVQTWKYCGKCGKKVRWE